jgi:hypothetical protein
MGTLLKPDEFDCYSKLLPDEPFFVLVARDLFAPAAVHAWCDQRELHIRRGFLGDKRLFVEEIRQLAVARECADEMPKWRRTHMGLWRPTPLGATE